MKKDGASYGSIAEEFEISKETAYRNVKEELERQTKRSKRKTEQSKRKTNAKQTQTKRSKRGTKRFEEIAKRRDEPKRKSETERGRENKRSKPQAEREAERPEAERKRRAELREIWKKNDEIREELGMMKKHAGDGGWEPENYVDRKRREQRAERVREAERKAEEAEEFYGRSEMDEDAKGEAERLSTSDFRKSLNLFAEGKDFEKIAEELDVPPASVEYELLPYVNELKTARRLQKKAEVME